MKSFNFKENKMEESLFSKILWRIIVPLFVAVTAGMIVAYCSKGDNSQKENQIVPVENIETIPSPDRVVSTDSSTPSAPIQSVTSSNEESTNFFVKGWNTIMRKYEDYPISNIKSAPLRYIVTTLAIIVFLGMVIIGVVFILQFISSILGFEDEVFWTIPVGCVLGVIAFFYLMSIL